MTDTTAPKTKVTISRLIVPGEVRRNKAMRAGSVLQGAAVGGTTGAVAGKYLGGNRGAALGGAAGTVLGAVRGGLKATERQEGDATREERRIVREAVREAKKMKKTSSDFLGALIDGPGIEPQDLDSLPLSEEEKSYLLEGEKSAQLEADFSLLQLLATKIANCPPNPVGGVNTGTPGDPEWPAAALGTGAGSKPSPTEIRRQNDKARPQDVSPKTSSLSALGAALAPTIPFAPLVGGALDAPEGKRIEGGLRGLLGTIGGGVAGGAAGGLGGAALGGLAGGERGAMIGSGLGASLVGYGGGIYGAHRINRALREEKQRQERRKQLRDRLQDALLVQEAKTAGLAVPRGLQRMAARQRAADAAAKGRKGVDRIFDTAAYRSQQAKEQAARVAAKHKEQAEGGLFRSPATRRLVEAVKTSRLAPLMRWARGRR